MQVLSDGAPAGDGDRDGGDRDGHGNPVRPAISTVGALVAVLSAYPPQTAVRLALHPTYPVAVELGAVACSPDDVDADARARRGDPTAHERVVWISEGTPHGYLSAIARDALGGPWATRKA